MIPSVVSRQLRETVLDYLRTTFALADSSVEQALFDHLESDKGLFRGPYVDVRLPFRKSKSDERSPLDIDPPFLPYKHQHRSFERLYSKGGHQPQHTLVTTGTGSGKTECFQYPILDHCWRLRDEPGIKAIILYPMNALATDQARRLAELLWNDSRLKSVVSAGLFIGGNGTHGAADEDNLVDKKEVLRASPPDILLTNYKMLDFLLLRPEDRRLWEQNGPDTLRYLVLDELHTYDGAQGSDVACLIRRLKNRLGAAPGSICCVGTSATIGEGDGASRSALTNFAAQVFDEHFPEESVITEDRLDVQEALGDGVDNDTRPALGDLLELDPEEYDSPDKWREKQAELWGLGSAEDRVALGDRLKRHGFLRSLLQAVRAGVASAEEIDAYLAEHEPGWSDYAGDRWPLLESFLGLVSHAQRREGEGAGARDLPFLTVHVQLWVRELRGLLRKVDAKPEFNWGDTVDPEREPWLPIVHCRECGASGWAAAQREDEAELVRKPRDIGEQWLRGASAARAVLLGNEVDEADPLYLSPASLRLGSGYAYSSGAPDEHGRLPVRVSEALTRRRRFRRRCPECGSDDSLSILGSQAASLLSVAISHLFQSAHNSDKKLLAFTDSVQDASHRAGFFGARTYRFNLRTAIQRTLEDRGDEVPLSDLTSTMLDYWSPQIDKAKLIATFWPADLRHLPRYVSFLEKGGGGSNQWLERDLADRLSWELTMEYGHSATFGRTLERTLCSTVRVDEVALDAALDWTALELEEEGHLESREAPTVDDLRPFALGLLRRLRLRGGIYHGFLDDYLRDEGKWFRLTKRHVRLMSPFGSHSRLPRFLTDSPGRDDRESVFDAVRTGDRLTWFSDWAARSLGTDPKDPGLTDLYRTLVEALTRQRVLVKKPCGRRNAWGLDPATLRVTREVAELECSTCRRRMVCAAAEESTWLGQRCPQYRCAGTMAAGSSRASSYYARVYRTAELQRIFSEEHTGLLQREDREKLERSFKEDEAPDAPNLFVCTPTLEMGIDIGDLSAAVLCSVPPSTASYLQRIGRAGRKTGNALTLTLVNNRPHDLYFHEAPKEMLEGEVLPPGCFLDAPAMLRRQMVAHAMDAWARQETELAQIPNRTTRILGEAGRKAFPGRFQEFYRKHAKELTEQFLRRFGTKDLRPENAQRLREYGEGDRIALDLDAAFDGVKAELDDLKLRKRRARERRQAIEKEPELSENVEQEKEDLDDAEKLFARLIQELSQKYPLNTLTDAGVLPNYAFPEPGVSLESVIRHDSDDGRGGTKRRYTSHEYMRPASSAIKEFAPLNAFYAEGRRVRIDEIDVGSRARPLTEAWRFCAVCAHMERIGAEEAPDDASTNVNCPRCGDTTWSDAGQVRTMVHFRRVRSLESAVEATSVDDDDDRARVKYATRNMISVGREHHRGARAVESLPFGYEYLRDLPLREVNFGKSDGRGNSNLRVAGEPVGEDGFEVCLDCGRVRDPNRNPPPGKRINHAPHCSGRRTGIDETRRIAHLSLYREVESEAIRILLPVAELGLDERRASFQAALEFGFRRWFHGSPIHLIVRSVSDPIHGGRGGHRHFLVVFDAVPGGTGYLNELWNGDNFLGVLEKALTGLTACVCQNDGSDRDGCYRCIYAYQEQWNLPSISSRLAQDMLETILDQREQLAEVDTLSDVDLDTRLESELERLFLEALEAYAAKEDSADWQRVKRGGDDVWRLRLGGRWWEILAQSNLGPRDGVELACRPDFLIRDENADPAVIPVAVFCDGLAYHACPGAERGRIEDDIHKRQAILDSGRYQVWSVTWKDVETFKGAGLDGLIARFLGDLDRKALTRLADDQELTLDRELPQRGSMRLLVEYLTQPDQSGWKRLAHIAAVAWVMGQKPPLHVLVADSLEHQLSEEPLRFEPGPLAEEKADAVLSRFASRPWVMFFVRVSTESLRKGRLDQTRCILRLFDEEGARAHAEFEASWRVFLQAWNLLQFHDQLEVVSSEMLDGEVEQPSPSEAAADDREQYERSESSRSDSAELAGLLELATEEAERLILAVFEAGLPLPQDGSVVEVAGRVDLEAEFEWPALRLALPLSDDDAPELQNAGWEVVARSTDPSALVERIRSALKERGE